MKYIPFSSHMKTVYVWRCTHICIQNVLQIKCFNKLDKKQELNNVFSFAAEMLNSRINAFVHNVLIKTRFKPAKCGGDASMFYQCGLPEWVRAWITTPVPPLSLLFVCSNLWLGVSPMDLQICNFCWIRTKLWTQSGPGLDFGLKIIGIRWTFYWTRLDLGPDLGGPDFLIFGF